MSGTGLPERIKILGIPYKINWIPSHISVNDTGVMGMCSTSKREITMSMAQASDSAASVLVHEIFHAVYNHTGEPERELNEETAATLSELLVYALFDNPELMQFLTEAFQAARDAHELDKKEKVC